MARFVREVAPQAVLVIGPVPMEGEGAPGEETLGVVRAFVDPDNVEAEYGILIRSDTKGAGLGRRLMTKMIDFLRGRGTQRLMAIVLAENTAMLELAVKLGFQVGEVENDPAVRRVVLTLS